VDQNVAETRDLGPLDLRRPSPDLIRDVLDRFADEDLPRVRPAVYVRILPIDVRMSSR
jgi:hypothetical protein